jgi:hypothetical protein
MPCNLIEALDEFIKLGLLNEKYDFDKFTQYIMSKKVITTTKTFLVNLYSNSEKTCKEQLFLSIWLIYRFSDVILNHNIEIEKTIKHYCNEIVSTLLSIDSNIIISKRKEIINVIDIYTAEFNKWKVYDKNVSVKEFIERYNNISKSIELVCKDALNDMLRASVLNSLHQQQKEIINLALKYDKKWNADFFNKHYDIIKNIENICNEKYWSTIQTEFNNKNYDMFYKNMDEIKKIIIELNGKNVHNIAMINNTITTDIIKNNLFIYDDSNINHIIDISCHWYKQFCTYILTELKNLSSPIRDVEYNQYLSRLLSITPTNYNTILVDIIKTCYKIIDSLYLDLLLFVS